MNFKTFSESFSLFIDYHLFLYTTGVAGKDGKEVKFPIAVLIGVVFAIIFIAVVVVVVACYIR